jgi:hypothetical protein
MKWVPSTSNWNWDSFQEFKFPIVSIFQHESANVKTCPNQAFFIWLENSWSEDIKSGFVLFIWRFEVQIMAKKKEVRYETSGVIFNN